MKIGILTIGNELTSGRTQDTNASLIARTLNAQGWQVPVIMSAGDDEQAIKKALEHTLSLADAVVITGGLGPTADDITTAAIAAAFNLPLHMDEAILKQIQDIFEKYRLRWTPNNAKQALFPAGAEVITNPTGTAPGFALRTGDKLVAVIPGVPFEVKRMLPEGVLPLLKKAFPEAAQHVETRTIKLFGLSEAGVDQALADIDLESSGVSIGFYPTFPENHVVLTARHHSPQRAKANLQAVEQQVVDRLKHYVFAYDDETLEGVVAAMMTEKKLTLAVAESCTGGLITDRLTDIPGSSAYLERGVITYSNLSKSQLLGVPEDILREFGAVSEETVRLMAEGVRKLARTDLGLATTGIAGPTGGTEAKPVGTICIALTDHRQTICRHYAYRWNRRRIKVITAQSALMMLKRYLKGEPDHA